MHLRPHTFTSALLAAGLITTADATLSAQSLLRDLTAPSPNARSSSPAEIAAMGTRVVFRATTAFGIEPWVSDGTPQGTFQLRDIEAGSASSTPQSILATGTHAFFTAQVDGLGRELWGTDGTSAGTQLLIDANPGRNSGSYSEFVVFQDKLFFSLSEAGGVGFELYVSDGTPQGTQLFADLNQGSGGSSPRQLTVAGGLLFFQASDGTGSELWATDGTLQGTAPITNLPSSLSIQEMVAAGNRVFFEANDGSGSGLELWVSDGTAAGTFQVTDIRPGGSGANISALQAVAGGSRVTFAASDGTTGIELWSSDGTAAGTVPLGDFNPGSASSSPAAFASDGNLAIYRIFTPATGSEVIVTDGTTFTLHDLRPGSSSSSPSTAAAAFGGFAVQASTNSNLGSELHFVDADPANTRLIRDIRSGAAGSSIGDITSVANRIAFRANDGATGTELWFSDGTAAGTTQPLDIFPPRGDSDPGSFTPAGPPGSVAFVANDGTTGIDAWVSDGTPQGTQPVDIFSGSSSSQPLEFTEFQGEAWFTASDRGIGREFYSSDGTVAGTGLAVDVLAGASSSNPSRVTSIGGRLYFSTAADRTVGTEPWVSDGTPAGTQLLADVFSGTSSSSPDEFTRAGSRVIFTATTQAEGRELWTTDGTPAGTQLLVDLRVGSAGSNPSRLVSFGNLAACRAAIPGVGTELVITDGTPAGTTVLDLRAGTSSSSVNQTVGFGDRLLFTASIDGAGRELWICDGTLAGTVRISDILPGSSSSTFTSITDGGNGTAFFFANDGTHGDELWATDGTLAGTRQVADINPGAGSGVRSNELVPLGGTGIVAFIGTNGADGLQLFVSDGTPGGTVQVGRIGTRTGTGAATIENLGWGNGTLFFAADDGITGVEPWALSLTGGGVAFVEPYGTGCRGSATPAQVPQISAVGLPRIGNAGFAVAVSNARPATPALLNVSFAPSSFPIGACRVLLAPPLVPISATLTDATGQGALPIPVPNDPNLIGSQLFAQWVVVDAGGQLLGLAALSNGLRLQLGN